MSTLHVLRVFTAVDGSHGNPLGVFLDAAGIDDRQEIAADLGFSETVFVDDTAAGALQIFTPTVELPLAGHPLVGSSWLIARERGAIDVLRPPAGEVPTWREGEDVWIRANPESAPPFGLRELGSPDEVDALSPQGTEDAWAWSGEGSIRSRVFAGDYGIAEDEATGAAALRLVAHLGRPVEIRQGQGSRLLGRPGPDGTVEIGGRVVLDEQCDYVL